MAANIDFYVEDINFTLQEETLLSRWIKEAIQQENHTLDSLNFIFCSDNYLHNINLSYLQHDTFTDVITFQYSSDNQPIEGDVFISIDRVKENAIQYKITFKQELHRVIIHGVLHLCGYADNTPKLKAQIREKENNYLLKLKSIQNEKPL